MLKIVVIGGYAEKYVSRCLESLCSQTETDWEAQVVLDPIGDKTYENSLRFSSDKIKIKLNDTRQYGLHNIVDGIKLLNPKDDDIIVTIDADDWLYTKESLGIVKDKYAQNSEILVTHGSWVGYPNESCPTNNWAYSLSDFEKGIRKVDWRASHLRTFKYKIWKYVDDLDLRDYSGQYYKVSWDLALMWPMVEMAGFNRVLFIPEKIYVYNLETPFNDFKTELREQCSNSRYLASLKPYQRREAF